MNRITDISLMVADDPGNLTNAKSQRGYKKTAFTKAANVMVNALNNKKSVINELQKLFHLLTERYKILKVYHNFVLRYVGDDEAGQDEQMNYLDETETRYDSIKRNYMQWLENHREASRTHITGVATVDARTQNLIDIQDADESAIGNASADASIFHEGEQTVVENIPGRITTPITTTPVTRGITRPMLRSALARTRVQGEAFTPYYTPQASIYNENTNPFAPAGNIGSRATQLPTQSLQQTRPLGNNTQMHNSQMNNNAAASNTQQVNFSVDGANMSRADLEQTMDAHFNKFVMKSAQSSLDIKVQLPTFGTQSLSKVEKEFKAKFSKMTYQTATKNSHNMEIILMEVADFVTSNRLTEGALVEIFTRIFQGQALDRFSCQINRLKTPMSEIWSLFQVLSKPQITPQEARQKIERLISNPPDRFLTDLLSDILLLSFQASDELDSESQTYNARILARTSILKLLRKLYGFAVSASIEDAHKQYIKSKRASIAPGEVLNDPTEVNSLIIIATERAAHLTKFHSKQVNEMSTSSSQGGNSNNNQNKNNNNNQNNSANSPGSNQPKSIKLPSNWTKGRCLNCNFAGKEGSKYFHSGFKSCPFYATPPNLQQLCNSCGGYHAQKECKLKLARERRHDAYSGRQGGQNANMLALTAPQSDSKN